ncbi:MAG TPA: YciI family protein [Solirubrobacteraceae bacterium]|nr:YciI family protein [Solirubrobacteraceae bacterium]
MANYLLAYTGGSGMAQTEAEREAAMAKWGQWFQTLGSAVVNPGNPLGASASVEAAGTNGAAKSGLSGFSIVAADSLDAASELAKGCPVLEGGGKVDVYEAIPITM